MKKSLPYFTTLVLASSPAPRGRGQREGALLARSCRLFTPFSALFAVALLASHSALAQAPASPSVPQQPAAQTAPAPSRGPSGDDLLMRAASQLDRRASITAR